MATSMIPSAPPAPSHHPPAATRRLSLEPPTNARAIPIHGKAMLTRATSHAIAPGSPSGRCTLHHQHGAPGGGDFHAGASRYIGPLGLPQRVADAHLAAAVLNRLLHHQRT